MLENFRKQKLSKEINNVFIEKGLKYRINGFKSITKFAEKNQNKSIYIYEADKNKGEESSNTDIFIKQTDFKNYCEAHSVSNEHLVPAFLKKEFSHAELQNAKHATTEQIIQIVENHNNKDSIINILTTNTATKQQNQITENNLHIPSDLSKDQLSNILHNNQFKKLINENPELLTDFINSNPQEIKYQTIVKSIITKLKECKKFLEYNIESNEETIQSWLDENSKQEKWRMMIFGLEYTNHLSEKNDASGKRMDIFMSSDITSNNLIIIELKSPKADILTEKTKTNDDGTSTSSYTLSDDLSRAIPQILGYKRDLASLTQTKKDDYKLPPSYNISKCIIIIGNNSKLRNETYKEKFKDLRTSFNSSLEIWTYSDLINKIDITIQNLESHSATE